MTIGDSVDLAFEVGLIGAAAAVKAAKRTVAGLADKALNGLAPARVEAHVRTVQALQALAAEAALVEAEEREVYEPDELWCAARVREQEENFGRAQHPLYREIQEQHEKKWGGFTPNCSDIGPVNDEYFADKAALDATVDTIEASTPSDMFSQLVDRRRIDISVRCTHCLEVFERPSKFTVHLLTCDGKRDVEYHSDASQVSAPGSCTGSERSPGVAESPRSPATPGQPQPDRTEPLEWRCGCRTYHVDGEQKARYDGMCSDHIYRCKRCKSVVFPALQFDVAYCTVCTPPQGNAFRAGGQTFETGPRPKLTTPPVSPAGTGAQAGTGGSPNIHSEQLVADVLFDHNFFRPSKEFNTGAQCLCGEQLKNLQGWRRHVAPYIVQALSK